jgi:hypothetical protein
MFCPCRSALVGPDHQSAKKVLILSLDHEIMENENEMARAIVLTSCEETVTYPQYTYD